MFAHPQKLSKATTYFERTAQDRAYNFEGVQEIDLKMTSTIGIPIKLLNEATVCA